MKILGIAMEDFKCGDIFELNPKNGEAYLLNSEKQLNELEGGSSLRIIGGTIEEIDKEHFLLKLGCKTFIAHNCHEIAGIIEKSSYEYFER